MTKGPDKLVNELRSMRLPPGYNGWPLIDAAELIDKRYVNKNTRWRRVGVDMAPSSWILGMPTNNEVRLAHEDGCSCIEVEWVPK